MYEYYATYVKTIDGDTIDCIADLGFGISHKIRVRLSVVDTPERGQVGWAEATEFTRTWFENNPKFVLHTEKDAAGGFGRYLGHPYSLHGEDLIEKMLQMGVAKYTRD